MDRVNRTSVDGKKERKKNFLKTKKGTGEEGKGEKGGGNKAKGQNCKILQLYTEEVKLFFHT